MDPDNIDPRERTLQPTQEEIDAWAAREHARRASWLGGPSHEEKQEWASRYRWRAAFGLEESRLGPSAAEIEQWAAREHQRREAWLAGPSETEKQSWVTLQRRRAQAGLTEAPPTPEEIDAWALREQQRRREWLAGPTDDEKREWARRQSGGFLEDLMSLPSSLESEFPESAQRLLREAELAGKGAFYALSRAPLSLWSFFVRTGREFENEFYQEPRRRRVRY